ncbi:tyrosine-type recombinase/integrase [Gabonibacter massiliensis]|uniref:tyrosine-type recombinase/integrase n=1 Tax=Gabonibacter massiliensis TaxID=1720195 RepID=UPI00073EC98E|nr:tyrosine-type recombinase/integrase [Gabonibacter massiliensis]
MATVSFGIRTKRKDIDEVNIRVRFFNGRKCQLYGKTPYSIPLKAWDIKRETIKDDAQIFSDTFTFEYAQDLIEVLTDLRKYIISSFNSSYGASLPSTWLQSVINKFYEIKAEKAKQTSPILKENFYKYLERYKKEIKNGTRLTKKNTPFTPDTVRSRNNSVNIIIKFIQEKNYLYFEDVTMDFYNEFLHYCNNQKFTPQTTGKHIKVLKQLVDQAREEKLHTNTQTTLKSFKTITGESDTIYLTATEVKLFEKVDLTDHPELQCSKDIFLCGIYTVQRYSDYHRINKDNLIQLSNHRKALKIRQKKGGKHVVIPISPRLNRILKKYDFDLPKSYSKKINEDIKKIGELAGITYKVDHQEQKGTMVIKTKVEKYKLITSHTARRTGATLLYLAGMDTSTIMKITGHKSERDFYKYIRVTAEENALRLSKTDYFNKGIFSLN